MSDPNNAYQVRIPSLVFCIAAPLFVAARFWSRIRFSKQLGSDDWTILASLVCGFTVNVLMLLAADYGFGQHVKKISPQNMKTTLELFWIAQIFYKVGIALTKASILLLYLRIFVQKRDRILAWTMLIVVSTYGVAATLISVFQCLPVRKAWIRNVPGTCINLRDSWYSNAGFSIATDVIILLLPIPVVVTLQLPLKQKLGLGFVFGVGGFVTVTSVIRMTTLRFSSTSQDRTYDIISSLWTITEENVGIICACLPMLRAPLSTLFPHLLSSGGPATSSSYTNVKPSTRLSSTAGAQSLNSMNRLKSANGSRKWARLGKTATEIEEFDLEGQSIPPSRLGGSGGGGGGGQHPMPMPDKDHPSNANHHSVRILHTEPGRESQERIVYTREGPGGLGDRGILAMTNVSVRYDDEASSEASIRDGESRGAFVLYPPPVVGNRGGGGVGGGGYTHYRD
ncbi:hypothetical protein MMC09_006751 [Bachmanniomyces sp. S44760]|nr:hypothetical protein [Bachmanniomyces sp. S44760]